MLPELTPAQRSYVESKLGAVELLADMSWGDFDSTVLRVRVEDGAGASGASREYVIKACGDGPGRRHFARELKAYQSAAVDPLIAVGRGSRLVHADEALGVLILDYQPGALVSSGPWGMDADTHREAGRLLRLIHTDPTPDADWDSNATRRALHWLDQPHRLPARDSAAARRILEQRMVSPRPVEVVHTHGDYHPRNWLRDADGVVRVIDWGRYERRPAFTDFVRCASQEWSEKPELGKAFADGYGQDLRETEDWKMEYLRQAVGVACWAPTVGDQEYERQGWRMVREALDMLEPQAEAGAQQRMGLPGT